MTSQDRQAVLDRASHRQSYYGGYVRPDSFIEVDEDEYSDEEEDRPSHRVSTDGITYQTNIPGSPPHKPHKSMGDPIGIPTISINSLGSSRAHTRSVLSGQSFQGLPPVPTLTPQATSAVSSPINASFGSPARSSALRSFYQFQNTSASSLQAPRRQRANAHRRNGSTASLLYTPKDASPTRSPPPPPVMADSPSKGSAPSSPPRNFHFGAGSGPADPEQQLSAPLPKPSRRRGHHYQHSSASMNMFQRAPNPLPTEKELPQYPTPSLHQIVASVTSSQKAKLAWCVFQLLLSPLCYTLGYKYGSICLSTLSHVVLYDAFGNLLSVVMLVLTNFDVWKNSSITFPFGLGRMEVLVGFGLSVSLVFVGVDLLSHVAEELVIDLVMDSKTETHEEVAHVHESPEGPGLHPLLYYFLLGLVVLVSISSSKILNGDSWTSPTDELPQARIHRAPSLTGYIPQKGKRLSSITLEEPRKEPLLRRLGLSDENGGINTSTVALTVIYALYCMFYPLLRATNSAEFLSQASTVALSALILAFGTRLIKRLANTLLLKGPSDSFEQSILANIQQLDVWRPSYKSEELLISRVNHKTFIIVLKMGMPGASDDDESKFRFYTSRLIRNMMYRSLNGQMDGPEQQQADRRSLIGLINFDSSFNTMDESGEQFEITIDINRD